MGTIARRIACRGLRFRTHGIVGRHPASGAEERLARCRRPRLNQRSDGDVIGLTRAYQRLFCTLVQRCGGGLTLAVLVLQLGLSFGHFHARDFAYQSAAYSRQQAAGDWSSQAKLQASAECPSKLADDDDQCPICFSSFLLANSFIPDALGPAIPVDFRNGDGAFPRTDHLAFEAHRAAFQPRAPPFA